MLLASDCVHQLMVWALASKRMWDLYGTTFHHDLHRLGRLRLHLISSGTKKPCLDTVQG